MARVNIEILGISELKWTGTGEFNSDDHYIYYCGQLLDAILKTTEWSFFVSKQTIQYHSNTSLCPNQ